MNETIANLQSELACKVRVSFHPLEEEEEEYSNPNICLGMATRHEWLSGADEIHDSLVGADWKTSSNRVAVYPLVLESRRSVWSQLSPRGNTSTETRGARRDHETTTVRRLEKHKWFQRCYTRVDSPTVRHVVVIFLAVIHSDRPRLPYFQAQSRHWAC